MESQIINAMLNEKANPNPPRRISLAECRTNVLEAMGGTEVVEIDRTSGDMCSTCKYSKSGRDYEIDGDKLREGTVEFKSPTKTRCFISGNPIRTRPKNGCTEYAPAS